MERIWNIVVNTVTTLSIVVLLLMMAWSDWPVRIATAVALLTIILVAVARRAGAPETMPDAQLPREIDNTRGDFTGVVHRAALDAATDWVDVELAGRDPRYVAIHAAAKGIKDDP